VVNVIQHYYSLATLCVSETCWVCGISRCPSSIGSLHFTDAKWTMSRTGGFTLNVTGWFAMVSITCSLPALFCTLPVHDMSRRCSSGVTRLWAEESDLISGRTKIRLSKSAGSLVPSGKLAGVWCWTFLPSVDVNNGASTMSSWCGD
jgi:hypothetical protein